MIRRYAAAKARGGGDPWPTAATGTVRRAVSFAVDHRVEVRPPWPFRLRLQGSLDGVQRVRGQVVVRLLEIDGAPALVRIRQLARDRVLFGAQADALDVAQEAIARMRFATGVDEDLRPFYERFRFDPLIGAAVRNDPHLRIRRRPDPWEALLAAVTEQLIELQRAGAIQRRVVAALAPRCPRTGMRPYPTPAVVAGTAPARLESFDLSAGRALTLIRAAREVAAGRVDLAASDHERGWRRLRAIPGVGPWTLEMLALYGQGRHDQLPAGDLGYLKAVGRLLTGEPYARATEDEVREVFAPYAPWAGLAGAYFLRVPRPAGTRWSGSVARRAA
jgi:3-methyladenine DNA glycosylase/8-oxoguanine DNA glycosylase